jgi:hypothetical protein
MGMRRLSEYTSGTGYCSRSYELSGESGVLWLSDQIGCFRLSNSTSNNPQQWRHRRAFRVPMFLSLYTQQCLHCPANWNMACQESVALQEGSVLESDMDLFRAFDAATRGQATEPDGLFPQGPKERFGPHVSTPSLRLYWDYSN